ncbi:hypothetical protein F5Y10DRAFT_242305 [Nemania abortiva]|nr:hypothetical protein F5Y10DRAFT_242305 [Nemania abortiva]
MAPNWLLNIQQAAIHRLLSLAKVAHDIGLKDTVITAILIRLLILVLLLSFAFSKTIRDFIALISSQKRSQSYIHCICLFRQTN